MKALDQLYNFMASLFYHVRWASWMLNAEVRNEKGGIDMIDYKLVIVIISEFLNLKR